jgi:hypothetical protein
METLGFNLGVIARRSSREAIPPAKLWERCNPLSGQAGAKRNRRVAE